MTEQRVLVMGDNHGDADSLRRVVEETEGETFDFIIHVGDLTNASYTDEPDAGRTQLESIAPHFESLAQRGTLIYIWGNRDGYGDSVPHDVLDSGILLHEESKTIDGQRFTTDPSDVTSETILITHGLYPQFIDHFEGRAYFSGHVHVGRYRGRVLNSAFLYRDGLHGSNPLTGGYFVVTVKDEPPFDVGFRNLDGLKRVVCLDHIERGVLFQPHYQTCMFCYYEGKLEGEMLATGFYGCTQKTGREAVSDEELIEYAMSLFNNPPDGFEESFTAYLQTAADHSRSRIERNDDGRLTLR
ncbi:metallophosphoesterase [Salinigranum sp.]|uniref:metallophosphoesterase family protein n=1 Tax=Salinigranum sp. TaxID=1966351 RepID=UPI00356640A2